MSLYESPTYARAIRLYQSLINSVITVTALYIAMVCILPYSQNANIVSGITVQFLAQIKKILFSLFLNHVRLWINNIIIVNAKLRILKIMMLISSFYLICHYYLLIELKQTETLNSPKTGVTKTPAISPASKTPAQPCLYYENTCYRKFTKTPAV